MNNIKLLIFEDETLAGTMLADYCSELGYQVLGIFSNGRNFIECVEQKLPDLLLLDINLGGTNGLDLYTKIKEKCIPVIFVTAYGDTETIDRAMNLNPAGYLIKPITKGQLKAQLIRAQLQLSQQHPIIYQLNGEFKSIYPSEIVYMEADRNYTLMVNVDGEKMKIRKSFTSLIQELKDERLIRVHRSYIINMKHLKSIKGTMCRLINDLTIPVGRSYKEALDKKFGSH